MTMLHTPECFAAHLGLYAFEPLRLRQAVAHIKAGRWPQVRASVGGRGRSLLETSDDGLALLPISGPMFKGFSKFSEANSAELRRAVREAGQSADVKGLLLVIDSPGGTVAGTDDLAAEVAAAAARKPVHAYIEDLGASAAYWVASQALRVTANPTAEVGSIGTVAVVEDSSGAAELSGIVVHVISTGPYKGAFSDGAPVSEEHLADLQRRVDALNSHFLAAVQRGRRMDRKAVESIADGRVHIASEAQRLGLVDAVGTMEEAVAELRASVEARAPQDSRRIRRAAAKIRIRQLEG